MIWSEHPVRVRAPATSANLGPGFDALGLALGLHDEVEARVTVDGLSVAVSGEGEKTAGSGEQHLVVAAMRAAFGAMGGQPPGIALRCVNVIPHGRGLGSSAAAVVSGILAARGLVIGGAGLLPDADALALAVDLEGHPDNVAACLAGGLTIAWRRSAEPAPEPKGRGAAWTEGRGSEERAPPRAEGGAATTGLRSEGARNERLSDEGRSRKRRGNGEAGGAPGGEREGRASGSIRVLKLPVLDSLSAVVCVAPTEVATRDARRVLPELVPHADAAANAARSALLVAGLTSDPAMLFDATEDFLHQRYRAAVMPASADLLGRLRQAGVAAVVSGAGPSILAMTVAGQQPGPEVVDSIVRETGIPWHVIPLDVDRQGAAIQPEPGAQPPDTRQGRSSYQAPEPGVEPAGTSPQGRVARSATYGPQSGECRGLLWC